MARTHSAAILYAPGRDRDWEVGAFRAINRGRPAIELERVNGHNRLNGLGLGGAPHTNASLPCNILGVGAGSYVSQCAGARESAVDGIASRQERVVSRI